MPRTNPPVRVLWVQVYMVEGMYHAHLKESFTSGLFSHFSGAFSFLAVASSCTQPTPTRIHSTTELKSGLNLAENSCSLYKSCFFHSYNWKIRPLFHILFDIFHSKPRHKIHENKFSEYNGDATTHFLFNFPPHLPSPAPLFSIFKKHISTSI